MENKKMFETTVSIITPSYNSSDFIIDTIDSVIAQTFYSWELIIVDDQSKDNSVEIIESIIKENLDKNIILIKNRRNLGPALSRNEGIKHSKGRYIAFLDSDDLWEKDKLEIQIDFMEKNNYPFTYSYYSQISETGFFIKNIVNLPLRVNYRSTIKSNKIGCLTAVYDTQYFNKVFMENIAKRQDYTLWLKLLRKVDFAHCVPQVLAKYRLRKDSVSSNKLKLVKYHWHIYNKIEKHSFLRSLYFLIYYIVSLFFNRLK